MLNTPFSPWPHFTQEEAEAISRVLLSNRVNYWTGEECRQFEKEFAAWVECKHAIALANGTVALEFTLKALDIGPGDEVVVTPRSFLASASSIITVGATPLFADVDKDSQNITAESIRAVLTPRTRAVICVHLAGWPCDMDPIMALAEQHNLVVIEDCAQAHGARYKGRSVGTIGHAGAWSFCQDKIMTTGGEGGMVSTSDPELWSRIWSYKDHGKSWNAVYGDNQDHQNGFRWLHESFGTNGRMTEIQATIGRIQLRRMEKWHAKRMNNARFIWDAAKKIKELRVPEIPGHLHHAAYKCYLFVRPERLESGWSRDRILQTINENGVPCYSGSCSEVYREKAFESTTCRPEVPLPNAHELGETSLMFLVHPTLEAHELEKTVEVLSWVMKEATADR